MTLINTHPSLLRAGDVLPGRSGYTVLADAVVSEVNPVIYCRVQFTTDGGKGIREWDATTDVEIQVERADA